eukprot:m.356449 g.356449  ORF g.356449 m.356449 type:complete len:676 (+) comp17546_c0_seq1:425-2452(+)
MDGILDGSAGLFKPPGFDPHDKGCDFDFDVNIASELFGSSNAYHTPLPSQLLQQQSHTPQHHPFAPPYQLQQRQAQPYILQDPHSVTPLHPSPLATASPLRYSQQVSGAPTIANTTASVTAAAALSHRSVGMPTMTLDDPLGCPAPKKAAQPAQPSTPTTRKRTHASAAASKQDDDAPSWRINPHETCAKLFDEGMKETSVPMLGVQIDKGFKRGREEHDFICQKKNHFQVTVAIKLAASPKFVATDQGVKPIESMFIVMHGIKTEKPDAKIHLEQSQSDRTKRAFKPVAFKTIPNEVCTVKVGRLHFGEPTANNMRKRGRINPEQRYFALVVTIAAKTEGGHFYSTASLISDRIIVRASNPRQFENDQTAESLWEAGDNPHTITHFGMVGIGDSAPTQALSVHGNISSMGSVLQPCDSRLESNPAAVDTATLLKNVTSLNIYQYAPRLTPSTLKYGIATQDLLRCHPDSVVTAGTAVLPGGKAVKDVQMLDTSMLVFSLVGAVKELSSQCSLLQEQVALLQQGAPPQAQSTRRRSPSAPVSADVHRGDVTGRHQERDYAQDARMQSGLMMRGVASTGGTAHHTQTSLQQVAAPSAPQSQQELELAHQKIEQLQQQIQQLQSSKGTAPATPSMPACTPDSTRGANFREPQPKRAHSERSISALSHDSFRLTSDAD